LIRAASKSWPLQAAAKSFQKFKVFMMRSVVSARNAGFCVRETPEWKMHAADLEAKMIKRAMAFDSSIGQKTRRIGPSDDCRH